MADDELDNDLLDEEADVPEDLDEADLEDLDEDDLDDDDALDEDTLDVEDVDEVEDAVVVPERPAVKAPRDDDEEEDEDDDEPDTDDVEASLDVILKERLVVPDDDEEEDDDDPSEGDERSDSPLKVLPKQPGEFVCQSCFLVKHPSQLADAGQMLCRDCV